MSLFDDIPAEDAAPEPDLPPIQGTDKQFNWATAVRKKQLAAVRATLDETEAYLAAIQITNPERACALEADLAAHRATYERLCVEITARYWLAHRDNSAAELLADADAKPGITYTWRNNVRVEK